jgi:hypothetical protein
MGLQAAAPTKPKPETFKQSREREAFESMRRHIKNVVLLRLESTDHSTRVAAGQWQEIIEKAEAQ